MVIILQRMEDDFMNEFKTYHPIVNFVYFVFVIGFSMFFLHPICLVISFVCGFVYSVLLKGEKALRTNFMYMLPMVIIAAIINPAFNHEGVTIITYLPSGNPLTLESIAYGLAAAVMLVSVICWFSCYNEIMTSDKFIYLFGRIIPSMSLVISMALRFIPRFTAQIKTVANVQRCMGRDISNGSLFKRLKYAFEILSIMTTWSLENAIETADSMKSRGYGHSGRTAYSIFTFDKRDKKAFLYIVFLGVYTTFGCLKGGMSFEYFPSIKNAENSLFGFSVFVAYALLCMCPLIIEYWEARKWKSIISKI